MRIISLCLLRISLYLNYKIWGTLQERVCKTVEQNYKIKDVHELRERIADEWDKLDQHIIDKAFGEWRKKT